MQCRHVEQFTHLFLGPPLLRLLAASLMACTYTRQLPAVKVAQKWRFMQTPAGVIKVVQGVGHRVGTPLSPEMEQGMGSVSKTPL